MTQANAQPVPEDYIRKQTLVNAERYITPELKEYESLILNAEERVLELEGRLVQRGAAADRGAIAGAVEDGARHRALDVARRLAEVADKPATSGRSSRR